MKRTASVPSVPGTSIIESYEYRLWRRSRSIKYDTYLLDIYFEVSAGAFHRCFSSFENAMTESVR